MFAYLGGRSGHRASPQNASLSTVELINTLEQEKVLGKAGKIL
jgi:hypothetical protein